VRAEERARLISMGGTLTTRWPAASNSRALAGPVQREEESVFSSLSFRRRPADPRSATQRPRQDSRLGVGSRSVAVAVTVALTQAVVWAAAALLVLLMFSSYALRSWSPRVASLALMGAITVYVTGAGYITVGRIGWFVLALVVGFGWLAIWETVILPDNPVRSLHQSVQAFSRRAADTVAGVVDVLNTARDSTPSEHACKALRRHLELVRSCRSAIERQFPGAVVRGFSQPMSTSCGWRCNRPRRHSRRSGLDAIATCPNRLVHQ
jgi:hypothetical protein